LKDFLKKWLGREIGSLVSEAISNFVLVVVLTVLAVLLGLLKEWCAKIGSSGEILFFVGFLEYTDMICDGALFAITCLMLTWKWIKKLSK
jgi:hypothetical protein